MVTGCLAEKRFAEDNFAERHFRWKILENEV